MANPPLVRHADDAEMDRIAREHAKPWRTLLDVDDASPGDLLFGMLEPNAPNMIYSAGGVGKGSTSAYLIREAERTCTRSLIYDAENHPREWRRRVTGLGADLGRVVYLQPSDLPRSLLGKPLHNIVPYLGEIAHATNCGLAFVDSILAGANLSEEGLRSDVQAPYLYANAWAEVGITSVSIGHTTKQSPTGDPFGSVSWTNAMRLTWLGARAEGDGHRVRWQPRKRNERGHIPSILLTFEYSECGQLCGVRREDDEHATRDWIIEALMGGPQTVEDLAEQAADTDEGTHTEAVARAKERIRKTLGRMRVALLVHKTGGRGAPWALGAGERVSRNGRRDTDG